MQEANELARTIENMEFVPALILILILITIGGFSVLILVVRSSSKQAHDDNRLRYMMMRDFGKALSAFNRSLSLHQRTLDSFQADRRLVYKGFSILRRDLNRIDNRIAEALETDKGEAETDNQPKDSTTRV